MKRKVKIIRWREFLLSLILLICLSTISLASEIFFEVKPGKIPYFKEDKIFSAWNPKNHPDIRTSGMKIFFFGKAEGCSAEAKNGPVKEIKPDKKISNLVGLPLNMEGKVFIPVQSSDFCDIKEKPQDDGSFVYINENPKVGGIGLFTASGLNEKGVSYFFQSRGEEGVGGGVNKFEKSTAVTWRLEKELIFPFKDKKDLKIQAISSVESLPSLIGDQKLPIQVRQQIEIGFANKNCLKQKEDGKILCLNKYVFDFMVKRWGGKSVDEDRGCLIFIDKAQGGLPHIACYSKLKDTRILEKKSKLDMATSCGEGLYQDTFRDKNFCYTISWYQFLNSLKAIASNHLNKRLDSISEKDFRALFGENYDNPENWYITVISFQQELHDPYKDKNIFIGGNIKEIKIEGK